MKGIDVYSGQGDIDFNKVKSEGIEVVYIKATEGITYTDPTLKSFYDKAKMAGLKVGFYHFLRNNNPIEEAKHFLNNISNFTVDCKYAIDVELVFGQSATKIKDNVTKFANYFKINRGDVVIYTYTSFLKEYLNGIDSKFQL